MKAPDRETGVVLLAAGRSERFGDHKLTALFRTRPLWEWSALAAEKAGFGNRTLVVAPGSPLAGRKGWRTVVNPDAAQGMGTSIAAGARASDHCSRLVVMLADMPLVPPAHLRALASARGTVFTGYGSARRGCPAAFPRSEFARLAGLDGDSGARSLDIAGASVLHPEDEAWLADIDTPDDLVRLHDESG